MIKKIVNHLRNIKNYYFFSKNPFCIKPIAPKSYYLEKFNLARLVRHEEVDSFERECGFSINKTWLDDLALHTQVVKKESAINFQHGRILYSLLRKYILENNYNHINILETGTARGFSSICMSKAIIDSKINGDIFTIDVLPNDKKFYWNCIDDHESKKTRKELLAPWKNEYKNISFITGPSKYVLKKIKISRINYAFIDAMHDYENVINEFNFIMQRQVKNDLIIFDDVTNNKFDEVVKAVSKIKELNSYTFQYLKSENERQYVVAKKII